VIELKADDERHCAAPRTGRQGGRTKFTMELASVLPS